MHGWFHGIRAQARFEVRRLPDWGIYESWEMSFPRRDVQMRPICSQKNPNFLNYHLPPEVTLPTGEICSWDADWSSEMMGWGGTVTPKSEAASLLVPFFPDAGARESTFFPSALKPVPVQQLCTGFCPPKPGLGTGLSSSLPHLLYSVFWSQWENW